MIKLIQVEGLKYIVMCPHLDVAMMGDLPQAVGALDYCGVNLDEIQYALAEFRRKGDDTAEFGVNRLMTFTCRAPKAA